jgi:hypothetical protein
MNRLHTSILAGGLLLSPILLTGEELLRTTAEADYVENDADPVADAASQLQAVADHLPMWHAAAYVDLAYLLTWAIGLLAITIVVARVRPVLGTVTGLCGLASVVGVAFHWAFYYLQIASLAQVDDRGMAAQVVAEDGDGALGAIALLMFLLGTLLAVLTAGIGLWRARALTWYGAIGLAVWVGYVFAGPEARLAALLNLSLLLPFVGAARRLSLERIPTQAPGSVLGPSDDRRPTRSPELA